MLKMKNLLLLLLGCLVLAGCATNTITNLTSSTQPRNASGQYPLEYEWDSNMATIRPGTITPYVVIGVDLYPMRQTLRMTNRWETLVPIPPDQKSINYRFKVDYEYNRFGKPGPGSKLSPEYKLSIQD